MSWTAELKSVVKQRDTVTVTIAYTDGKETIEYSEKINGFPGDDYVQRRARNVIRDLENLDRFATSQTLGPIDTSVEPEPEPEQPSEAEVAKALFFEKFAKLNGLKAALEKGLIKADDATLAALTAEVKAAYLPEYAEDYRIKS